MHILEEHPEVIENLNSLNEYINNPDMVLIQNDKKDTIWIIKKINSNLKITIRLNTIKNGRKGYINSIIQMQYMHNIEINRNIKIGKVKILYKKSIDIKMNV